jgi:hypothetical protein
MDAVFTSEFWKSQIDVVASAPWAVLPLLILVAVVFYWLRGRFVDGELAALRAENAFLNTQLEAAKTSSQGVDERMTAMEGKLAELTTQIGKNARPEVIRKIAEEIQDTGQAVASANSDFRDLLAIEFVPDKYVWSSLLTDKAGKRKR